MDILLFFAMISSGSVLAASYSSKKYEDILPITCIMQIIIVYIFAIFNHMYLGALAVISFSGLCYLCSLLRMITYGKKQKDYFYNLAKQIFTPNMFVFLLLYLFFVFINRGRMAQSHDEFSHWIDIVKVFTTINDFGFNPKAHSLFQSYPPGMAIFQYLSQRLFLWVNPGQNFSEWRCFLAYQVLCYGIALPVYKNLDYKKILPSILIVFAMFILPTAIYSEMYSVLYIDPFLGFISGIGLIEVFIEKRKDNYYYTYIVLLCCLLTLTKDVGIVMAFILAAFYAVDYIAVNGSKKKVYKDIFKCGIPFIAFLSVKYLWKQKLVLSNAWVVFDTRIDVTTLIHVLTGEDTSYKREVLIHYIREIFEANFEIASTGIKVSYISFMLIQLLWFFFLTAYAYEKQKRINYLQMVFYNITVLISMTGYILGMGIIYMFNFSEQEALGLASLDRYLGILFLPFLLLNTVITLLIYFDKHGNSLKYKVGFGGVILLVWLISAPQNIVYVIGGEKREESCRVRSYFMDLSDVIQRECDENDKIYLISQETTGYQYYVMRYLARPSYIANRWWSIGVPFYEGDIYTQEKTAEQLKNELLNEDYDYLAILRTNDYFNENYSSLFAYPYDISGDSLYWVNKEDGLLYRCDE